MACLVNCKYAPCLCENVLLRTDNDLLVSEMKLKLGVTGFVSEMRRVENLSDFDKLVCVIQNGL